MIKKNDFIWSIGFQGNTAIVNKRQKAAYRSADPVALLGSGMLRASFCAALWELEVEKKADAEATYLAAFVRQTGIQVKRFDDLKRVLGVQHIPQGNLHINSL